MLNGGSFAHPECYYRRQVEEQAAKLAEALSQRESLEKQVAEITQDRDFVRRIRTKHYERTIKAEAINATLTAELAKETERADRSQVLVASEFDERMRLEAEVTRLKAALQSTIRTEWDDNAGVEWWTCCGVETKAEHSCEVVLALTPPLTEPPQRSPPVSIRAYGAMMYFLGIATGGALCNLLIAVFK